MESTKFTFRFYNYNSSSFYGLMLTWPFHYVGGNAPYQGAVWIVELDYTKVNIALQMVELQNSKVDHDYW